MQGSGWAGGCVAAGQGGAGLEEAGGGEDARARAEFERGPVELRKFVSCFSVWDAEVVEEEAGASCSAACCSWCTDVITMSAVDQIPNNS